MEGYVSLHRRIREHWICDNPEYFKAWLFMLMMSNFKDGRLLLGGNIYTIKRGQSSLSMRSWAYELNMSTKAVETFFKLLEKDGMIKREIIGKGKQSTTLITIENYDDYQGVKETQKKRKRNATETQEKHEGNARGVQYNNDNNDNKDNKDNNDNKRVIPSLEEFISYAKVKKPNVKIEDVRFKYDAWLENDWHKIVNGENAYILNWKTTLLNCMKYMREENTNLGKRISV